MELDLPVPHSFVCNPVFGRDMKYRSVKKAGCARRSRNGNVASTSSRRKDDCVPTAELGRQLRLTPKPAQLVQRRLRWFGHAASLPGGGLFNGDQIKDLLLPAPPACGAGELEAS